MDSAFKKENDPCIQMVLLKNLRQQGYHVLPGLLSPDRVKEVRSLLKEKFEERFTDEELERDDTIPDHLCVFPELMNTFFNDRLLESIRISLGDQFVLLSTSCIRNSYKRMHTDLTTAESVGATFHFLPDFNCITIGIYLQDCDAQGGGLFVVPESHKKRDPLVKSRLLEQGIGVPWHGKITHKLTQGKYPVYDDYSAFEGGGINIPSKAGDAVIFDMRLLHRGSKAIEKRELTKYALFYHLSAVGESCDQHIKFLFSKHGHCYLREPRNNLKLLQQKASENGFSAI